MRSSGVVAKGHHISLFPSGTGTKLRKNWVRSGFKEKNLSEIILLFPNVYRIEVAITRFASTRRDQ